MHSEINTDQKHQHAADLARKHIDFLAASIGARPSCRPQERQAAEYTADQLTQYGFEQVSMEPFRGSPSSYARYMVALILPGISAVVLGLSPADSAAYLLIITSLLGAMAILQESDFRWNWTRLLIPSLRSVNVTAQIPAADQQVRDIILTAHLDTHRTPWFNASRIGQRLFRSAFRWALIVLAICLIAGIALLITDMASIRWPALICGGLLVMLGLVFLQADFTPFSPGAYDNASGVGSLLALGKRLIHNPLENCKAWLVFTGCEETGSAGMQAFLDRHFDSFRQPLIINLDQMGSDVLYARTCEGFIVRRCVDVQSLRLASHAAARAGVTLIQRQSQAFSDAAIALQRGMPAISLGTQPGSPDDITHRHRSSDLPKHIDSNGLIATQKFISALLELIDTQSTESASDD
ncbi:MAG: M28 family peptidase [Anaerolineales bacterium]